MIKLNNQIQMFNEFLQGLKTLSDANTDNGNVYLSQSDDVKRVVKIPFKTFRNLGFAFKISEQHYFNEKNEAVTAPTLRVSSFDEKAFEAGLKKQTPATQEFLKVFKDYYSDGLGLIWKQGGLIDEDITPEQAAFTIRFVKNGNAVSNVKCTLGKMNEDERDFDLASK